MTYVYLLDTSIDSGTSFNRHVPDKRLVHRVKVQKRTGSLVYFDRQDTPDSRKRIPAADCYESFEQAHAEACRICREMIEERKKQIDKLQKLMVLEPLQELLHG
jgi:hypothetical protein